MNPNSDQPYSHALSPCKTLWFEFLISPDLLHKHLTSQKFPDPNPVELIISFLNNVNVPQSSQSNVPVTTNNIGNNDENSNSANLNSNLESNGSSTDSTANSSPKKYLGIKLLALKVAAYLNWDLDILENNLPITMQFTLLDELIKICDNNADDCSCGCSLFAYMNYYRWILRSIIKLSYPTRKSYYSIPVLQQTGKIIFMRLYVYMNSFF